MISAVATIVLGLIPLFFGRKLFFFFIFLTGFLVGMVLVAQWLPDQPEWVGLVAGAIIGGVAGILAMTMTKPVAAVAGFFALGTAAALVANSFHLTTGELSWLWFGVGGLVGAILVYVIFDYAVIAQSAFIGATSVTAGVLALWNFTQWGLPPWAPAVIMVGLAALGFFYQAASLRRR
jgi:hypothetical protein